MLSKEMTLIDLGFIKCELSNNKTTKAAALGRLNPSNYLRGAARARSAACSQSTSARTSRFVIRRVTREEGRPPGRDVDIAM